MGERSKLSSGRIDSKAAARLSEFELIHLDINDGIRALRIWGGAFQVGPDKESDHFIKTALFRDAVGRFVECFEKKVKGRANLEPLRLVKTEVFADEDGSLKFFEWLVELRNSLIAHRHGRSRQYEIGVFFDPRTGGVASTSGLSMRYATPELNQCEMFVRLFQRAADHASSVIEKLWQSIDREVAAMSVSDLLNLKPTGLTAPSSEDMQASRSGRKRD